MEEQKDYKDMTESEQVASIIKSEIYHWRHLEKAGLVVEETAKRRIGALQFVERYIGKYFTEI